MADNEITITGNLTREPEIRFTTTGPLDEHVVEV